MLLHFFMLCSFPVTVRGYSFPLLFQGGQPVTCAVSTCEVQLSEACGHTNCCRHSKCGLFYGTLLVWHPGPCSVCWDYLVDASFVPKEGRCPFRRRNGTAPSRPSGCGPGAMGNNKPKESPYILDDSYCQMVFPKCKYLFSNLLFSTVSFSSTFFPLCFVPLEPCPRTIGAQMQLQVTNTPQGISHLFLAKTYKLLLTSISCP